MTKKILHIVNSLNIGGAEKLIVDSLHLYENRELKIGLVVLLDKKTPFYDELVKKFEGEITFLTKGSIYNPLLIFRLIPIIKKYDLIHAHLFPTLYWFFFARLLCFKKEIKLFYTEHSTNNRRRNHPILSRIDRLVYSNLDFIGCISEGVYENLRNYLGESKHLKIIYNGINLDTFKKANFNINKRFFGKEDKILIQVSSFRKQKDQKTLINTLSLLPAKYKLLLVGDGPLRKEHEEQVQKLSLGERVIFLGIRNDIPELLTNSDVVILSSHYEGFGLAIVEGMAANKPVIASNIAGIRDIVENYGLLFKKGDSKDLADKIVRLCQDESYYREIQQNCLQRSYDFSIQTMVNTYITEYKNKLK